jgi:hypothetical protein
MQFGDFNFHEENGILRPGERRIQAHQSIGMRGEFRAELWNADGSLAYASDWADNTIVDEGLTISYMFVPTWYGHCCVGSDNTAPTTADTSIGTLLGESNDRTNPLAFSGYPRPPVAPNYERYSVAKYRFDPGVGTGTIREFTLGNEPTGNTIWCRHVLPAEIPKAADQTLDVFYRITVYPNLTPTTGQVTIDGVLYDWEASFYNCAAIPATLFAPTDFDTLGDNFRVYDGAKAGVTDSAPSGNTADGEDTHNIIATGSGYVHRKFEIGLDHCNTATNEITVITSPLRQELWIQLEVLQNADGVSGIPKDNTKEMSIDWRLNFGRYVP